MQKPADAKIFLYHIPAFTGFAFTPDFANRLRAEHGDVVAGIKDSTGDLAVSDAFVKQVPGFAVFPSAESSLAVARERGYAGCISATVNATAPFAAEVWRAGKYAAEALEAATSIRTAILGPSQVAAVKWAVAKLSGNESWARVLPPLRALKSERAAEIEQALDKYASLRAQL
ncbi:dihydrodipicolinate synthase family protein [Polaromonas sp. P1(28)-8]|nr:dihydrodipicolinate synthase family protein [Polaromonas sp. P1(28)-8]